MLIVVFDKTTVIALEIKEARNILGVKRIGPFQHNTDVRKAYLHSLG